MPDLVENQPSIPLTFPTAFTCHRENVYHPLLYNNIVVSVRDMPGCFGRQAPRGVDVLV